MTRARAAVALPLLICVASGCYHWRPVALGPVPTDGVRLGLASAELRVDSARIVEGAVVGVRSGTTITVPTDSMLRSERREFDWVTTAGVGALIVMGWICICPGC